MKRFGILLCIWMTCTAVCAQLEKQIRSLDGLDVRGIAAGSDGYYVLAYANRKTQVDYMIHNHYTPKLLYLDGDLQPQWELPLREHRLMEFMTVEVIGDRVYLGGIYEEGAGSQSNSHGRVVCTDLNGYIVWDRIFPYPGHHSSEIVKFLPGPDGQVLAIGNAFLNYGSMGTPSLLALDGAGKLLWKTTIGRNHHFASATDGLLVEDGNLLVYGSVCPTRTDFMNETEQGWAVKVDLARKGAVIWEKMVKVDSRTQINSAIVLENGSYGFVGSSITADNASHNLVMTVSPQGVSLRQDRWQVQAYSRLERLQRHPLTGVIYAFGAYKTALMSSTNHLQVVTFDPDFKQLDMMEVPDAMGGGFLDGRGKIISSTKTGVSTRALP